MVRILKSEPNLTPRIDAVSPVAALPGGEVEVRGSNLGAVAVAQNPGGQVGRNGGGRWRCWENWRRRCC